MIPGRDYIGVGVGAMVFNQDGKVFLAQRGPKTRNEQGTWEFPGGMVGFGEKLLEAIKREFLEEYGMEIEIIDLLCVTDHILSSGKEHWVAPAFIARHVSGVPEIRELEKCIDIGWFDLAELPEPLSLVTLDNLSHYHLKYD
jgi:ADP-ribose pyrophosphatase YjhB (NUDIX family)